LIKQLGYYRTQDGRVVEIIKIYQNQDACEGILEGKTYIWRKDGTISKWKPSERDIKSFIGFSNDND
jgi:hypothetical protein